MWKQREKTFVPPCWVEAGIIIYIQREITLDSGVRERVAECPIWSCLGADQALGKRPLRWMWKLRSRPANIRKVI